MNIPIAASPIGRVLVVDDVEANRVLIADSLEVAGYEVRNAASAEEALVAIASWGPDVILLDVMMPRVDGIQFCRRLKANPATIAVPVILMTALGDRTVRIRGIDAGADEFLLKPIENYEVILRVRNAIRAKRLYDGMRQAHDDLRRLEQLRDGMTHMIVHDLRSPLTAISMCVEVIKSRASRGDCSKIVGDAVFCLRITETLTEMISTILDVSRLEAGAMPIHAEAGELGVMVEDGVARVREGDAEITIEVGPLTVTWDRSLIARAIANLVSNALKYASGTPIHIRAVDHGDEVEIQVDDGGPGVPSAERERIFEKFGSLAAGDDKRYATGLGLHFCKQVAVAHGGSIGVSPLDRTGSRFWMRLPKLRATARG
jgi:signal transduction histidine kinase